MTGVWIESAAQSSRPSELNPSNIDVAIVVEADIFPHWIRFPSDVRTYFATLRLSLLGI
jgi:hypothetical protein